MKKWKCSVCNFVIDSKEAPETCPKCGAPREKFNELQDEQAKKIDSARETNSILMTIAGMLEDLEALAENGIEIDLDPGCKGFFKKLKGSTVNLKQNALAEIENHVKKEKWG